MDNEVLKKACEALNIEGPKENEKPEDLAERMGVTVLDWIQELEGRMQDIESHLGF